MGVAGNSRLVTDRIRCGPREGRTRGSVVGRYAFRARLYGLVTQAGTPCEAGGDTAKRLHNGACVGTGAVA